MQREAAAAAEQLEDLLTERDADRKQLAETQQALQEAMQHLEDISDKAQVRYSMSTSASLSFQHFRESEALIFLLEIYGITQTDLLCSEIGAS